MPDTCEHCGRPNATPSMEGDEAGVCFRTLNLDDDSLRLDCYEHAIEKRGAVDLGEEYRRRLRDHLAGLALQGMLSDASNGGIEHEDSVARFKVCELAKKYADQLIASLKDHD